MGRMRLTITEPAAAHPRLPAPRERLLIVAPGKVLNLAVLSAEVVDDTVIFVLDWPDAIASLRGEPVPVEPMPTHSLGEPFAYDEDGGPVWRLSTAPHEGEQAA